MNLNAAGIALIKEFESCKLQAYQKPGDLVTIGWGNTFYQNGQPIKLGDRITQAQADALFEYWLEHDYVPSVRNALRVTLNDNQFSALVSYRYNVAPRTFRNSALLKLINSNPRAANIAAVWHNTNVRPGSIFERGLRRRRVAEAALYHTPMISNPLPPDEKRN